MAAKRKSKSTTLPIRHRAADVLQESILTGRFEPGREIPQLWLAREFGLSQSSIREALQELENRGLIRKHGRNWMVTRLSHDDLGDLYEVRAALEPLACRLAAYGWREEQSQVLYECLEQMKVYSDQREYAKHSEADMRFHQFIWSTQPNRILEKQLNSLCMPLFAYDLVQRSGCARTDFERSARQHRMMIEVLSSRDGIRTERVIRRLIQRFHRQDEKDFHAHRLELRST